MQSAGPTIIYNIQGQQSPSAVCRANYYLQHPGTAVPQCSLGQQSPSAVWGSSPPVQFAGPTIIYNIQGQQSLSAVCRANYHLQHPGGSSPPVQSAGPTIIYNIQGKQSPSAVCRANYHLQHPGGSSPPVQSAGPTIDSTQDIAELAGTRVPKKNNNYGHSCSRKITCSSGASGLNDKDTKTLFKNSTTVDSVDQQWHLLWVTF